jgi:hypothetical protein
VWQKPVPNESAEGTVRTVVKLRPSVGVLAQRGALAITRDRVDAHQLARAQLRREHGAERLADCDLGPRPSAWRLSASRPSVSAATDAGVRSEASATAIGAAAAACGPKSARRRAVSRCRGVEVHEGPSTE